MNPKIKAVNARKVNPFVRAQALRAWVSHTIDGIYNEARASGVELEMRDYEAILRITRREVAGIMAACD